MLLGKLLLLYNMAKVCYCIGIIAVLVMGHRIAVNLHAVCYATTIASMLAHVSIEVLGTCVLHQFAYTMYCSD